MTEQAKLADLLKYPGSIHQLFQEAVADVLNDDHWQKLLAKRSPSGKGLPTPPKRVNIVDRKPIEQVLYENREIDVSGWLNHELLRQGEPSDGTLEFVTREVRRMADLLLEEHFDVVSTPRYRLPKSANNIIIISTMAALLANLLAERGRTASYTISWLHGDTVSMTAKLDRNRTETGQAAG